MARNLKIVSELCQTVRDQIRDITPDELKYLDERVTKNETLTDDETMKRTQLKSELDSEINKFLSTTTEVEFFKINFPL